VVVDQTVCVGIGQCEMLEPDVFFINDDAFATVVEGATIERGAAQLVVERCPSGAISIVADDGGIVADDGGIVADDAPGS
jgi:ferredoxin